MSTSAQGFTNGRTVAATDGRRVSQAVQARISVARALGPAVLLTSRVIGSITDTRHAKRRPKGNRLCTPLGDMAIDVPQDFARVPDCCQGREFVATSFVGRLVSKPPNLMGFSHQIGRQNSCSAGHYCLTRKVD